jgi:hypothetical protein
MPFLLTPSLAPNFSLLGIRGAKAERFVRMQTAVNTLTELSSDTKAARSERSTMPVRLARAEYEFSADSCHLSHDTEQDQTRNTNGVGAARRVLTGVEHDKLEVS